MKNVRILFDCDNTLVESESLAFAACCEVVNATLTAKQVNKQFTPHELMERFVGKVFWKIISELAEEHGFELSQDELDALTLAEQNAVIAKLAAEVVACDGVNAEIASLACDYELAVVSSSALARVNACLSKTGQNAWFAADRVFSAASSLEKPTSKPDPAIYLHAMNVLGTTADQCIAIEDSVTGVLSAVRAGIPCVGYTGALPEHERAARKQALLDAGCKVVISHWGCFRTAAVIANRHFDADVVTA